MRIPGFGRTYDVRCPDGTTRKVYRKVEDAFPLHLPGFKAGAETTLRDLMGHEVGLRAEYATHIQGLLYSLSELNESVMMSFRATYVGYTNEPCAAQAFFLRKIDELTTEVQRCARLRVELRGLVQLAVAFPNDSARVWEAFGRLVAEIGGPEVNQAVRNELGEARSDAQGWITPDQGQLGRGGL